MLNRVLFGLVVAMALALTGCSGRGVDRTLDAAENLMESQPDSALAMLERVDGAALRGERQARHALLLSQAYNKNYIDLTDDSLISIAVNYYGRTDNSYYKMLAYLYHANVLHNAAQCGPALHAALNAHDLAAELADTLNLTRTESLLGRIYVMSYDFQEGLRWDMMALEKARYLNNPLWLQTGYENIAGEYLSMSQEKAALQYADSAMAISHTPSPRILDIMYRSYFGLKMDDKADSVLAIMYDMGITPTKEINDVIDYYQERSPEEVIAYLNQAVRNQNQYIIDIFKGNLSASLTQYLDAKSRQLNDEIEKKRAQNITLIILGVMITAVFVLLLIAMRLRAKNQRIQSENAVHALYADYERVRQEVENNRSVISELQNGVEQLSQQATDARRSYINLRHQAMAAYMQRFSWVNKLGNLYLEANLVNGKSEQRLYKKVSDELRSTKNSPFVAEIEQSCKEQNPELWAEISSLNLIRSEREMLLLYISGVSTRVICLVTDKSPASVYNSKTRIKNKLLTVGTPFAQYLHTIL